jgi:uncharacterized repeat protein (TIGR03803 family)
MRTSQRIVTDTGIGFMLLGALAILIPCPGAAQAVAYATLYSFQGSPDGVNPQGALVIGTAGALFGTTVAGGTSQLGTVFVMRPIRGSSEWKDRVLHSFSGLDGQSPSNLVSSGAGALYGTTSGGGAGGGGGVIYELAPRFPASDSWTERVLHNFPDRFHDPSNVTPNELLIGPLGTLFTTTQGQSINGLSGGLVIALAPPATPEADWTEFQLYSFGEPQGELPVAGVVFEGGSLFGTTFFGGGGECGCGNVYELTPPTTPDAAWTETILHTFTIGGPPFDGEDRAAPLTIGPGGVPYGTTEYGGSGNCATGIFQIACGTVFQLTPPAEAGGAWSESVLYSFGTASGDGAIPVAGLVRATSGALYGTTKSGGTSTSACSGNDDTVPGCGTVFELRPPTTPGGSWTERVLHSFTGENGDGAVPVAALVLSSSGILYGTTSGGGTSGNGTVFAVVP